MEQMQEKFIDKHTIKSNSLPFSFPVCLLGISKDPVFIIRIVDI